MSDDNPERIEQKEAIKVWQTATETTGYVMPEGWYRESDPVTIPDERIVFTAMTMLIGNKAVTGVKVVEVASELKSLLESEKPKEENDKGLSREAAISIARSVVSDACPQLLGDEHFMATAVVATVDVFSGNRTDT